MGAYIVVAFSHSFHEVNGMSVVREVGALGELVGHSRHAGSRMLLPARLPLAPRAGLDNILARAAPPSLTYWLHQLLVGSLLGRAQAATENRQQVKPDIGVAAEYTA